MKLIMWVVLAVIVGGGIAVAVVQTSKPAATNTTANTTTDRVESDGTVIKADGTMVKPDGTMVKPDGTMIGPDGKEIKEKNTNSSTSSTNTSTTAAQASYVDYSASALAAAEAKGRTVIYFHAPWCPICVVLDPQLKAQIGTFPGDVTILKTDYDSSTELKKKYGVTYQHTFVQVDKSGNKIKLWTGGDVQTIKDNII